MHRRGREGGANYLQVVTKDMLEDQIGLSISIVRLASRCGIQLASLKEIFFLFQMQLSAKCLVSPGASERGAKSEVAHKWAKWIRHPCRLGDPHRCRAGGQNQSWPTCGQSGYVTSAVSGISIASERGAKSEVAHKWAKWLRHPCRLGDPHRFRAGGGGDQKWPTCGQSGYATPAVSEIPTASEQGAKSEVAHLVAKWLRHPCRLGDPHHFRAGGEIRSGPLVGKVATSPLVSRGSPPVQSGGGGGSEVAHKWARWLRHPCRLGDPHRCRFCFLLSFLLSKKFFVFY